MLTRINPMNWAVLIIFSIIIPTLLLFYLPEIKTGLLTEDSNGINPDISELSINMSIVNTGVNTLAADPENLLVIKVVVKDINGAGVPGIRVKLNSSDLKDSPVITDSSDAPSLDPFSGEVILKDTNLGYSSKILASGGIPGSIRPSEGVTARDGSLIFSYSPPSSIPAGSGFSEQAPSNKKNVPAEQKNNSNTEGHTVTIKAQVFNTEKSSSIQIKLIPVPIILVHGYQASPDLFSGLSQFLRQQGYYSTSISYSSENGVASGSDALSEYIRKRKDELKAEGIQTNRFDLISHSMGGLVARYYTSSSEYSARGDVRKLIFVSVPQKGSPFAALGLQYVQDSSLRDMAPDSSLFQELFPAMINGGLNPSIETGNILGRYDEVVGVQGASLSEWKIDTGMFDVGESNLTVDKLINGEIFKAANHKLILYNKKVYKYIEEMLETTLPYPSLRQN